MFTKFLFQPVIIYILYIAYIRSLLRLLQMLLFSTQWHYFVALVIIKIFLIVYCYSNYKSPTFKIVLKLDQLIPQFHFTFKV